MRHVGLIVIAVALCAGPARAGEGGVRVPGRVVDAGGKALAGAEVAAVWLSEGERMRAQEGVKTDAEGKFEISVPDLPVVLMAMAPDGERGGVVRVRGAGTDLEIPVEPLVLVEGRLAIDDPEIAFGGGVAILAKDRLGFAVCRTRSGTVTFRVPPGDYTLEARAEDAKDRDGVGVTVAAGPKLDLGKIDLQPSLVAKSYGKAAPAVTAIERGDRAVGLDTLRGKWVLLEFWAFW